MFIIIGGWRGEYEIVLVIVFDMFILDGFCCVLKLIGYFWSILVIDFWVVIVFV